MVSGGIVGGVSQVGNLPQYKDMLVLKSLNIYLNFTH